jgi:hypothetical protein
MRSGKVEKNENYSMSTYGNVEYETVICNRF